MARIYESIDELVGRTPILRLRGLEKKHGLSARVYAKLEFFNPAGSAKDRIALKMINDAEAAGELKEGSVIIEPTSGNTGIGLAAIGAARGYKVIIVMPDTMSIERRKIISAYGAEIVLSDGKLGMKGAIELAEKIANETEGAFVARQFENPSNPEAQYNTTGPEIYEDTDGDIDIFVAGVGTGGTISGTGRYLKSRRADIKAVGAEPKSSPFITEGRSGAHGIQGIGAGFLPKTLDTGVLDEVITVEDEDAFAYAREACRLDGIFVGISSGAAIAAAVELAKRAENFGKSIVALLPDGGEKYLSTKLLEI